MLRKDFAKSFVAFNQMGKNVVKQSRKNLSQKRTRKTSSGRRLTSKIDNTGTLSKSMKYSMYKGSLTFEMAEHGLYVDLGRKAGKYAPVDKIEKWVKQKPVNPRDKNGRFIRKTPATMKSLAFLLNRAIYRYGITPTYFFTKPFDAEFKKLEKKLPKAIEEDIDIYFSR